MAHSMTLPALAGFAIVAVGAGVHLGFGAVAEMDGAHRGEAAVTRPFASLTPNRSQVGAAPPRAFPPMEATPMPIGMADLGGCYSCGRTGYDPYRDGAADTNAASPPPEYAEPDPVADPPPIPAEAAPPSALDEMERYARYPVSEDEADAPVSAAPNR